VSEANRIDCEKNSKDAVPPRNAGTPLPTRAFTTLGFGDVKPQTELAAIIVMFEVIIRYVMLGGLVEILATKLARSA